MGLDVFIYKGRPLEVDKTNRETEKQRNRDTDKQRNRETEKQTIRKTFHHLESFPRMKYNS